MRDNKTTGTETNTRVSNQVGFQQGKAFLKSDQMAKGYLKSIPYSL